MGQKTVPSWSLGELEALLDLWEEEEALHDTRCIFNRMAQALSHQGHPARTLKQVRAKVKELLLDYVWASEGQGTGANSCPHYQWLHWILGQAAPHGPSVPVDTCRCPPRHQAREAGEEDEPASGSEDEGSTVTLQAETLSGSHDVSHASSEAGEGSTAGPSRSGGPSSPVAAAAPPAAQPPSWRVRQWDQLFWRHVQAVEQVEAAITHWVEADLKWHQEACSCPSCSCSASSCSCPPPRAACPDVA
ncbi:uncharacterized protein LOC142830391 [Pelodiscus sinensis]|uniref:uncharacterized protein LOC142830391 n=1 Tax=Pelodiscus sinensis TaxID=13735 RepID=UPI003F6B15C2